MTTFKEFFEKQQLQEVNLGRIWQYAQDRPMTMISASRGNLTDAQNQARTKTLEADTRAAGYGFVKAEGHYIENHGTPEAVDVKERVLIIVSEVQLKDKLKNFAIAAGKKFNQDSIFFKEPNEDATLIGTSAGAWPGLGKVESVGKWHPSKIGQFFTKLKNGKAFVFESVAEPVNLNTLAYKERV